MELQLALVGLLRLAWIAGILPIVFASFPSSAMGSLHKVVLGFAKRGKILPSSSQSIFTVPQKYFSHFYVVAVVWTTFLLFTTWIYAYKTASFISEPFFFSNISSYLAGGSNIFSFHSSRLIPQQSRYGVWLSVFLLLLMEVHVSRRLFENLFIFNYSPSARMHILGYFTGMFFYIAAPLSLCCNSVPEVFKFCISEVAQFIVRGKHAMDGFEFNWLNFVSPLVKLGWCQWLGAAIFLWGSIHQHLCHKILGSLRENGRKIDEYVIPHGDWFEIVSCPHYLAEIVIYGGLVFASGGTDLTIWLLFLFVVLCWILYVPIAAAETHRWYLHKFENYPRNRNAIFPWIY